ncbi:hypothetical protein EDF81_0812 [Enterobacter sp. BIGb0383]|nr:hypothetical protein EDF81_0812 [Enterobacter sp. BIGb0383]ROS12488.1 hypothetical protein EC848_0814 [Enterobacter sp. BIGb0359]
MHINPSINRVNGSDDIVFSCNIIVNRMYEKAWAQE